MPSSILFAGKRRYRPGFYGAANVDNLGGAGISTGRVAIVGSFPALKQATPATFNSAQQAQAYFDDADVSLIARLAFSPTTDRRIPGGAAALTFVGVDNSTQATVTLEDAQIIAQDSLTIKSRLYGARGNRVQFTIAVNADNADAFDVTLKRGALTETATAVESGNLAEVYYSGDDLTRSTLDVGPEQWEWSWEIDEVFAAGGGAQSQQTTPSLIRSDNAAVSVKLTDGAAGSTSDVTVTISGLNHLGAAANETFTASAGDTDFGSGSNAFHLGTVLFSRIDSVLIATDDAAYDGTVTIQGTAFDIDTSDFATVKDIVDFIGQASAQGFNGAVLLPKAGEVPASPDSSRETLAGGVDAQATVNVFNAAGASANKATVRADLFELAEVINASEIVTAERASAATQPPAPASGFLVGGGITAPSPSDDIWATAFRSLEASDVQIVVAFSDNIAHQQAAVTHAKNAAIAGRERQVWTGAAKSQTLTQIFNNVTSKLNSEYIAVVGQEVKVPNAQGRNVFVAPKYLAVMLAGMQAGSDVATPLTRKRPSVLDVRGSWDADLDVDEAISKGIVTLESDALGYRVARSVTTYLTDDNPILSEVSSWESILTSIRDLRAGLEGKIGNPIFDRSRAVLDAAVKARLNEQVSNGFIKAWQNVVVEDLGDTFRIGYEAAAIEPLNFIRATVNVVRIAGA